jgi:hypothetical protein
MIAEKPKLEGMETIEDLTVLRKSAGELREIAGELELLADSPENWVERRWRREQAAGKLRYIAEALDGKLKA